MNTAQTNTTGTNTKMDKELKTILLSMLEVMSTLTRSVPDWEPILQDDIGKIQDQIMSIKTNEVEK